MGQAQESYLPIDQVYPTISNLSMTGSFHSTENCSGCREDEAEGAQTWDMEYNDKKRKDSGYAEENRRPVYRISSDNGAFNFLKMQNQKSHGNLGDTPEDSIQKLLAVDVNTHDSSLTYPEARKQPSRRHTLANYSPFLPKEASNIYPLNLTSPTASIHRGAQSVSRTVSMRSIRTPADPYTAHQKAEEIIQALENPSIVGSSKSIAMPAESAEQHFWYGKPTQYASQEPSCSGHGSRNDVGSYEAEHTMPLSANATIDWMHPSTRRRTYEAYDRNARGIRGFLGKVTPRWCHGTQIRFYDGTGDDASVRRYRIDFDMNTGEEHPREKNDQHDSENYKNQELTRSRSPSGWNCFRIRVKNEKL